jgi:hypothetical protein
MFLIMKALRCKGSVSLNYTREYSSRMLLIDIEI